MEYESNCDKKRTYQQNNTLTKLKFFKKYN